MQLRTCLQAADVTVTVAAAAAAAAAAADAAAADAACNTYAQLWQHLFACQYSLYYCTWVHRTVTNRNMSTTAAA
jgi:hypothetical protein